jgi:hypothetical protein
MTLTTFENFLEDVEKERKKGGREGWSIFGNGLSMLEPQT